VFEKVIRRNTPRQRCRAATPLKRGIITYSLGLQVLFLREGQGHCKKNLASLKYLPGLMFILLGSHAIYGVGERLQKKRALARIGK